MSFVLVFDHPEDWPVDTPGVEVVSARAYLTDPSWAQVRGVTVFNLCRSYAYQSLGYYVTLLAEARGHRPRPGVGAMQDLRARSVGGLVSDSLYQRIQRVMAPLKSDEFTLSVYFGEALSPRYASLARSLFNQFEAPLLRARFRRSRDEWQLRGLTAIPISEVPTDHREFVLEQARLHFAGRRLPSTRRRAVRGHLAILLDPEDPLAPSNELGLKRFEAACHRAGLATERITKDDFGRVAEFDALFIRATTAVDHFTFRMARRAERAGLAVIDDPKSIVRAANKVYLHELLDHHRIRTPRTMTVHRGNRDAVAEALGLPCVLKQPDSAFSKGVCKASTPEELEALLSQLLEGSDLVLAQEYLPTDFDWRVGVLGGAALYACRYFMAGGHWQIVEHGSGGRTRYGRVECVAVEDAPPSVVRAAVRAARHIGRGLYGVDVKVVRGRAHVIEVNDNPNLDGGYEDRVLGAALWDRLAEHFVRSIEALRSGGSRP
ncbi:MAG: RimK family protein [Planctomycetes bacterium]|nr:RimK family protein [Planctomycetota bacterium]MDA0946948.1 RimK family protein [Planctomycetota bacterium]